MLKGVAILRGGLLGRRGWRDRPRVGRTRVGRRDVAMGLGVDVTGVDRVARRLDQNSGLPASD